MFWSFENMEFWSVIVLCWTILWKGLGLWKSASNKHRGWFILFLLINVWGIPEIIYLWYYRRKWPHGF